ncbi:hypothetical protein E4U61_001874 [Claviceps capensis]|nr:hypothetical protein E4U61_001874 [Claviceps capensis]
MSAAEKWMRQEDCTIVAFPEVNSQKEMTASVTREEENDKRQADQRKGQTDSGGADEDETGTNDGTDFKPDGGKTRVKEKKRGREKSQERRKGLGGSGARKKSRATDG